MNPGTRAPAAQSDVVAVDRACSRCGYNLRGLPWGGKCPECGTKIRKARYPRSSDSLTDAPIDYLKTLAVGLILMTASAAAVGISILYATGPWRYYGAAWMLVASLVWVAGVFVVTRPRPVAENTLPDASIDSRGLIWAHRLMQLSWPLAAAGLAVAAFTPLFVTTPPPIPGAILAPVPPPAAVGIAHKLALIFQFVGYFSLIPLSISLSGLAAWAGDTGLADRLRLAAWVMAVCGAFGLLGSIVGTLDFPLAGFILLAALFSTGGAFVALLLFAFSLGQLANTTLWSIRNAATQEQVDRRLERQRDRHHAEMAARTRAGGNQPVSSTPPGGTRLRGAEFDGNVLDRPKGGAAPYPVEPEKQ